MLSLRILNLLHVCFLARYVSQEISLLLSKEHNVLYNIQVIIPETACPVQYLHIIINSYSNVRSEVVQENDVAINFVGNMIVEGVPGLPARKKFHSSLTLIGWNGLAVDSIVTTCSK